MSFRFWLTTCQPCHLGRTDVPLMVNRNRLARFRPIRRSLGPWFIDSGGWGQIRWHGRYEVSPRQYVEEVRRWSQTVGAPDHVSCQDWLCEPDVLARTGLPLGTHQRLTVESYLTLRSLAPEVSWLPVLQGYAHRDYWEAVRLHEREGIDLFRLPLVGLGSVCQRQATAEAEDIIEDLAASGISLHAFGFKILGLERSARWLASADSANWSKAAGMMDPLPGHTHTNCSKCLEWALLWRQRVLQRIEQALVYPAQPSLFRGQGRSAPTPPRQKRRSPRPTAPCLWAEAHPPTSNRPRRGCPPAKGLAPPSQLLRVRR